MPSTSLTKTEVIILIFRKLSLYEKLTHKPLTIIKKLVCSIKMYTVCSMNMENFFWYF